MSVSQPPDPSSAVEWRRLSQTAVQISPFMLGQINNFVVMPYGEPIQGDGFKYVRAMCIAAGALRTEEDRKVLLKIRNIDWQLVRWSGKPLKVLQAQLDAVPEWRSPVIDCTGVETVLVSHIEVGQPEVLRVAEFFAGGFQGWTQAAYVMHTLGAPVSVAWGVEKSPVCQHMQQVMTPSHRVVGSLDELDKLDPGCPSPVMIQGDVADNWWLRIMGIRPTNTWAISAPCQPWSHAGRSSGLSSPVGLLMLRIADLAATFQPRLLLFEQVSGFATHKDCQVVLQAFHGAGYSIAWKATLELADLMPCQRSRHLLVFSLRDKQIMPPATFAWPFNRPTSLRQQKALFELPEDLWNQCVPSPQVLSQYLDPKLMPARSAGYVVRDPVKHRIKGPDQIASCFLAQYSFGHQLPRDLLEAKGLFGSMVFTNGVARFFSSAEIASLHGAVMPVLCEHDRRTSMRHLGNCIAVPHAAVTILMGCRTMECDKGITLTDVIYRCDALRLQADNASLLPCRQY